MPWFTVKSWWTDQTPQGGVLRDVRDPNGNSDTTSERTVGEAEAPQTERAIARARELVGSARRALASGDPADLAEARKFFGGDSDVTRARADNVFRRLEGLFDKYSADNIAVNTRNTADWGYVRPWDSSHISVTESFFNSNLSVDQQASILIHEGTHFSSVGGLSDHAYGRIGFTLLDASRRVQNADNYAYFAVTASTRVMSGGCFSSLCY